MTNKVRSAPARERTPPQGQQTRGSRGAATDGKLAPAVARWYAAQRAAFTRSRESTIPMLQSAQTALGWLPGDAIAAIARHVGVAPAVVEGVASFYAQFRFAAPGRHRVTVCSGTACYVRGSGKLMEDIQADLKIEPGDTTADGAVSLESVSCFGACALAPVVVLDDKVLRQQTSASLKKAIKDLIQARPKRKRTDGRSARAQRGARK
jgi:NADH-quinone oxidoreductase subunit E